MEVHTTNKILDTAMMEEIWGPSSMASPTTGAKVEDRQESRGQATKLWTGYKAENRRES